MLPSHVVQLLEECRVSYIREALLRLDSASKGMLACLLGPGGTLEVLSIALSRIDGLSDANSQLCFLRKYAGMTPLRLSHEALDVSTGSLEEGGTETGESDDSTIGRTPEEQVSALAQARDTTGSEVLELAEDAVVKLYQGGQDLGSEATRMLQKMCNFLGEVVSVEENYTRELLRLLERWGRSSANVALRPCTMIFHGRGSLREKALCHEMPQISVYGPFFSLRLILLLQARVRQSGGPRRQRQRILNGRRDGEHVQAKFSCMRGSDGRRGADPQEGAFEIHNPQC